MRCEAVLRTDSADAKALACALNADSVKMERLTVATSADGLQVVSHVESESLGSLLSTVDDLVSCQIASEALIENG